MRALTFSLAVVVASASHGLAQGPHAEALPEAHRVWLEEEVVYIITEREEKAFRSLATDEERRHFIDAFWTRRDPNPITPDNEFQQEHYRRLAHANTKLDAQSLLPGWKTERGRMYIILGDPRSIEQYNMDNKLVTTEHWFYEGDTRKGVPAYFNLIFFKRMDTGEFRLYSPTADTPSALLRGRFGVESQTAIETIIRISPELARASLSIEARAGGDITTGIASLENETTMMRIENSPTYAVRTDYLDGWERYGNRVAAEYSFNFVPSRSAFSVIPRADGTPFLHFVLELDPESFSVESNEDETRFYTTLDVSVEARAADGTLVLADDKETYIELTRTELDSIRMAPVAYQDSFPVVSGDYTVNVILKNRVHSRFAVAEHTVTVSELDGSQPALSDVVLGYRVEDIPETAMRTFAIGGERVHPSADRVFTQDEWLRAFLRVFGAGPKDHLRFTVSNDAGVVLDRSAPVADYADGVVHEAFALSGQLSGDYRLTVELVDSNGDIVDDIGVPFQISPRTAIPRPNFIARRQFPSEPGRVNLARAEQLIAMGRFEDSVHELELSFAANPSVVPTRTKLAAAYNRENDPDRALELLMPLSDAFAGEFDVAMGLGVAYYLKQDFEHAVPQFEHAFALRAPNASQLNALGNSYANLGRFDDARAAYQRSLAIDPTQASVEAALAALGKDG